MNHLTIIGNVTRDPETRTTQAGKTVTTFTVAVNRRKTAGQQEADFFRVSAWGPLGETCSKWLVKGRKVAVTGSVSATAYTAQDGTARASLEVFAQDVEFLSPASETPAKAPETPQKAPSGFVDVSGEQLPF